jgi:NAD(P)-dependent dehydrogenase (short-subunit alcohol dehydrogenase family)
MPFQEIRLDGQTAVVSGAGAGLGRVYAEHLAARGAAVVVNDVGRGEEGWLADSVVARIRAAGGRAVADYSSVATAGGSAQIIDRAEREFGGVDIMVANAGIVRRGGIDELTPEDIRSVLSVNLEGALWLSRSAFARMRRSGYGRIVLAASSAGIYGHGLGANYCASKGGVVGLLRALAIEGESCGIRANAVSPFALTPMTLSSPGLSAEVGRLLDPEHVAPVVVYLASRECSINGQVLATAGGTVALTFSATTLGWRSPAGSSVSPEAVRANLAQILDTRDAVYPTCVLDEREHLLGRE